MKINFKMIVLIIICVAAWGIFIFISKNDSSSGNTSDYLIVNNYNVWSYSSGNWNKLLVDSEFDEINMSDFDVYSNNGFIGKYRYALKNNVAYYFDNDYNNMEFSDEVIAISSDSKISLINYSSSNVDDKSNDIVNSYLDKLKLSTLNVSYTKYSLDSGDIYFVTNMVDGYNEDTFYVIFYRDSLFNKLIYNNKFVNEDFKYYDLAWILKIKKFGKNNIILRYECDRDICYDMYQYSNGKYELVIGS